MSTLMRPDSKVKKDLTDTSIADVVNAASDCLCIGNDQLHLWLEVDYLDTTMISSSFGPNVYLQIVVVECETEPADRYTIGGLCRKLDHLYPSNARSLKRARIVEQDDLDERFRLNR